ncbi:potassium-transporting ATPase subunit F [Glaciihabitans sp. INWT7]|nr:potassium-transporting ATPase subunit F [Glaciihabitans sp. INWT7]
MAAAFARFGGIHARSHLCDRRCRPVRPHRPRRPGGRETVIFFTVLSLVLGVAALVYLVFALVKPERF